MRATQASGTRLASTESPNSKLLQRTEKLREEALCLPKGVAGCLAGRVETRRRLLCLIRMSVRVRAHATALVDSWLLPPYGDVMAKRPTKII